MNSINKSGECTTYSSQAWETWILWTLASWRNWVTCFFIAWTWDIIFQFRQIRIIYTGGKKKIYGRLSLFWNKEPTVRHRRRFYSKWFELLLVVVDVTLLSQRRRLTDSGFVAKDFPAPMNSSSFSALREVVAWLNLLSPSSSWVPPLFLDATVARVRSKIKKIGRPISLFFPAISF